MHACIGVMRRLNRHVEGVFDSSRKDHHWGGASWRAIDETPFGLSFCYRFFFALALSSGILSQVVEPSVSRAAVLHGTAFTVFVEPSGPTLSRPGPLSSAGSGPVEYGVGGVPAGAYAPV